MPGQINERAFETYVQEILLARGGWKSGSDAAADRLQEYRTALITAAVTGKIHVRQAVPAPDSTRKAQAATMSA